MARRFGQVRTVYPLSSDPYYGCAVCIIVLPANAHAKTLPLGIAYAMWGGLGIVLTSIIGIIVFKQNLDTPAVVGIAMIVGGVVVMNVLSILWDIK